MFDHQRQPRPGPADTSAIHTFPCGCGLWRALPNGLQVGDVVDMVPCPRCGAAPRLKFHGAKVELVDPTLVAPTLVPEKQS